MKNFILSLCIVTIIQADSNAQPTNSLIASNILPANSFNSFTKPVKEKDYDYYMHKRKIQKTIGLALLGAGFGFSGIGLLLANSNSNRNGDSHTTGKAAVVIVALGAAAGLASIPFNIMAGSNRYKAEMLLEAKKTGYGLPLKSGSVTGLTLLISIGK